jgi:hypothetical protein
MPHKPGDFRPAAFDMCQPGIGAEHKGQFDISAVVAPVDTLG